MAAITLENILTALRELGGSATSREISEQVIGTDRWSQSITRYLQGMKDDGKVSYTPPVGGNRGYWRVEDE